MKGSVVVVNFPFRDTSDIKKRPALVLFEGTGQNLILAQITSSTSDRYGISVDSTDIEGDNLHHRSTISISMIFTIDRKSVEYKIGKLTPEKWQEVSSKIIALLQA